MKLVWFFIFACVVGFGFYWKREPHPVNGGLPPSLVTETALPVPTPGVGVLKKGIKINQEDEQKEEGITKGNDKRHAK
jgi:hypothetical protein